MISISKPQSAAQAKDYLSKETYYQQNSELGQWHGALDVLLYLGLNNNEAVDKPTYVATLNGIHPKSGRPLLSNSGSDKRRAGIDVTFSAPKSVSLLMALCEGLNEKKMEEMTRNAHEQAVQYAMEQISNHYVKTRIRKGKGKRELVNTKAIWASFQHDTTRETDQGEIDPQLHTHNFLMGLTFYKDLKTGVLKPYAMSNEEIYTNKMYLGQVYRNALASNLQEMGLAIEVTNINHGFFELKGFSEFQIDAFSGRHNELLHKLEQSDLKHDNKAKLLDLINARTKKHKKKIDKKALMSRNMQRMNQLGVDRTFLDNTILKNNTLCHKEILSTQELQTLTIEHIGKALDLLEEHHSVFGYEEIMKNTLKLGLAYGFMLEDYTWAFDKMMQQGRLIKLDNNIYSTQAIVGAEREVIQLLISGKKSLDAYLPHSEAVNEFIEDSFGNMTQGQREMVSTVLGTHDQFIVVQGDAGTGKTYAGAAIKQYMSEHHAFIDVVGLAFTGKAAQTLEEEGGITSSTLHRFLYQEKKGKSDASTQRLILVDEAGMAGSMQIAELMKVARQNGDKVVFIGDDKQFSSIAAGNIFIDMQKLGATTVHMSETMRQNSEHAKGIVMAVKNRQAERAINMLKKRGSFMENDREVSIEMIAQRYSEKYAFIDPLKDELIIASRNRDRIQINDRIRTHLGKHGTGEHHIVKEVVLQNGVGRYFTNQLEEGMVIIPSKIPNSKNGAEYQISTILDEKHIEIESSSGARTVIDFYHYSQQCQIYRKVEKEFSIGETIIFTKNTVIEDGKKVKNGERAVIENIGNGMIQTTDGKRIDIKTMNYVDHGYAITDFKSQGVTTKNITILADAQTASMNAFYTQVTRAKEDITIYTDNQEALLANLNKDVKMCSTLDYTTGGREIKKSVLTKQEIAQTFRGCGSTLSGVTFRLEKSLKKLNVSDSDSYSKNIRKYLIGAINKVVEKLDMVAQKLSKKPKKISSTLSLKHNRTKGERRVVKIKL